MSRPPYDLVGFDEFAEYNVREELCSVWDCESLETLDVLPGVRNDQDTVLHEKFYESFEGHFSKWYRWVLRRVLPPHKAEILVQAVPTLRIHPVGATAVERWHTDAEFGHTSAETNYWLPLTPAYDTNTLWVGSYPIVASYGQVAKFHGATQLHGNYPNLTGRTRVSLDFRTIPAERFVDSHSRSVASQTAFAVGHYWIPYVFDHDKGVLD